MDEGTLSNSDLAAFRRWPATMTEDDIKRLLTAYKALAALKAKAEARARDAEKETEDYRRRLVEAAIGEAMKALGVKA